MMGITVKHNTSSQAMIIFLLIIAAIFTGCRSGERKEFRVVDSFEIEHEGMISKINISHPSVSVSSEGEILVTWTREHEGRNNIYLKSISQYEKNLSVINPDDLRARSTHQSPGITSGDQGEVYVSWSSVKEITGDSVLPSDLILSISRNGGRDFTNHIRINEDRPISHSFEDIGTDKNGNVYVSWIDLRDGWGNAGTYLAIIRNNKESVSERITLDQSTCECCRINISTGNDGTVAVFSRHIFPGNVRDMVLSYSKDSGNTFSTLNRVHTDNWVMNSCPHRGGSSGIDENGIIHLSWYTEGTSGNPAILFASYYNGRFSRPTWIDMSSGSIPDHVRMAVRNNDIVIVWQDSTAVRSQILARYSRDGGKSFSPVVKLSEGTGSYAPDIAEYNDDAFVVIWHEKKFPSLSTVVKKISLD